MYAPAQDSGSDVGMPGVNDPKTNAMGGTTGNGSNATQKASMPVRPDSKTMMQGNKAVIVNDLDNPDPNSATVKVRDSESGLSRMVPRDQLEDHAENPLQYGTNVTETLSSDEFAQTMIGDEKKFQVDYIVNGKKQRDIYTARNKEHAAEICASIEHKMEGTPKENVKITAIKQVTESKLSKPLKRWHVTVHEGNKLVANRKVSATTFAEAQAKVRQSVIKEMGLKEWNAALHIQVKPLVESIEVEIELLGVGHHEKRKKVFSTKQELHKYCKALKDDGVSYSLNTLGVKESNESNLMINWREPSPSALAYFKKIGLKGNEYQEAEVELSDGNEIWYVKVDGKKYKVNASDNTYFEETIEPHCDDGLDEEVEHEFHDGMKVKLTPQYADKDPDEVFTLSSWDGNKGRISDEQGRGWNIRGYQIVPVEDSEEETDSEGNEDDTVLKQALMNDWKFELEGAEGNKALAMKSLADMYGVSYERVRRLLTTNESASPMVNLLDTLADEVMDMVQKGSVNKQMAIDLVIDKHKDEFSAKNLNKEGIHQHLISFLDDLVDESNDHHKLSGAPVPLKTGEKHCPYCSGYGHKPKQKSKGEKGPATAIKCSSCNGVGKSVDSKVKENVKNARKIRMNIETMKGIQGGKSFACEEEAKQWLGQHGHKIKNVQMLDETSPSIETTRARQYNVIDSHTGKIIDGPFDSREEAEGVYDKWIARHHETEMLPKIVRVAEMAAAGSTGAGSIASIPKPLFTKPQKRKTDEETTGNYELVNGKLFLRGSKEWKSAREKVLTEYSDIVKVEQLFALKKRSPIIFAEKMKRLGLTPDAEHADIERALAKEAENKKFQNALGDK